jgi:hypothetical protein
MFDVGNWIIVFCAFRGVYTQVVVRQGILFFRGRELRASRFFDAKFRPVILHASVLTKENKAFLKIR